MGFFADNALVLGFYGGIILLIFLNRKKFDIHGKIVALYRTKVGLKAMDKLSGKYREIVKLLGYTGMGIGIVGLVVIFTILVNNLWKLLTNPEAQSGVSLVIPGVHIPGAILTPPLIIGWIALFLVIVVHEFSHGVVAKAHDIKIKSSGLAFFGPLLGAFVEPDEKILKKKDDVTQYSVYAAGPFSNILLGLVVLAIGAWILLPLIGAITEPTGFSVENIQEGFPGEAAGLENGVIITGINGESTTDYAAFAEQLNFIRPDEKITLNTDRGDYEITTVVNPNDDSVKKGYIGIAGFKNERKLKTDNIAWTIILNILSWLRELFVWVYILSLGIGLANLLPLGPVDGGRIALVALTRLKGKAKGELWWKKISLLTLAVLALNIFWPLLKWISNTLMSAILF